MAKKSKKLKASASPLVTFASDQARSLTVAKGNYLQEDTQQLQIGHDNNKSNAHVLDHQHHPESKQPQKRHQLKKSKKRLRQEAEDAAEERRLTALLFGKADVADLQQHDDSSKGQLSKIGKSTIHVNSKLTTTSSIPFEIDREGVEEIGHSNDTFQLDREGGDDRQCHETAHSRALVTRDFGDNPDSDEDDDDDEIDPSKATNPSTAGAAVWVDEDDYEISVNLLATSRLRKLRTSRNEQEADALPGQEFEKRLRKRFQETAQVTARTDWAAIPVQQSTTISESSEAHANDDDKAEMNLLASTSMRLLDSSSQKLPPHVLNIVRCRDANQADPNHAVVQAVHFHPGSDPDRPLLLTAGLDKTLRFFQVGIEESEKIHGIHFPKLPIYSAAFLGTSGNVLLSGRRSFFYIYDAVAGKLDHVPRILGREEKSLERFAVSPDGRIIAFYGNDGYIILVDASTKHWMTDLKMNGSVRAICFTPDGNFLLASGSDGDVYRWDVRTWKCVERFANEDGTITSSLAATSRHLAVGAESGVVNLYSEQRSGLSSWSAATTRSPIKSIMNLSTSADVVRFNSDGQILAMSTRRDKHGLKLLHVPTGTVFSNWPTSKTPLSYVWSMDFSPQSRFLAIGNDKGKCLLYRLPIYESD